MRRIDKELERSKYKSFGKVKESKGVKYDKDIMELQNQKQRVVQSVEEKSVRGSNLMEVDNNIASALMKKQRENFERES